MVRALGQSLRLRIEVLVQGSGFRVTDGCLRK
jgi:hypothetical protein